MKEKTNDYLKKKEGEKLFGVRLRQTNLAGKFYLRNQNVHVTDSKVKDNVCNNKNNRKHSSKHLWESYVKTIRVSFQRGILFEKCQPYTQDAKSSGYQCCDSHNWCKKNGATKQNFSTYLGLDIRSHAGFALIPFQKWKESVFSYHYPFFVWNKYHYINRI